MAFTLQNNRVAMHHPVQGPQYERFKFQLGGVYTILPPLGKNIVNAQGVDIPIQGKRLQVTKELAVLIQSGFVRIAHDIDNTGEHPVSVSASLSEEIPPIPEGGGDSGKPVDLVPESPVESIEVSVVVSSHLTQEAEVVRSSSSSFSSKEEIRVCQDHERLRTLVYERTGLPNTKTPIDNLRSIAESVFERND
jgi:hypothetical protein